jgi:hypothetical protein
LPTADLIHAVPGLLLAAFLPGFLLATLIAPRWPAWERATVAVGLSAGFLMIVGLAMRVVHIPFLPATVLPVVAALGALAWLRWNRSRISAAADEVAHARAAVIGVVTAALLAGAVAAGGIAFAFHDQVLPPDWDPPEHGAFANAIVQTHDVLPTLPVPLEHTSYVRPRLAFEATAAMVAETGGPPPAQCMLPLVLLAVALMPLGLAMLALEATGSAWVAALTPLLSAGLAFPVFQVILGRFPLVIDASLVAAAVVAMARLARQRDLMSNALMLMAVAAAIWVTHGLEILSAFIVGAPLVIEILIRRRSFGSIPWLGAGAAAAAVGIGLAYVLDRTPGSPPASFVELANSSKVVGTGVNAGASIRPQLVLEYFAQTDLNSPVALVLVVVGVAAVVVQRRGLWALGTMALILVPTADVLFPQRLRPLWLAVWPWGDPDRLLGVAYWVLPMIMAIGIVAAFRAATAAGRNPGAWTAASIAAAVIIAVAVLEQHAIGHAWTSYFRDNVPLFPFGNLTRMSSLVPWTLPAAVAAIIVGGAWVALRWIREPEGRSLPAGGLKERELIALLATLGLSALMLVVGVQDETRIYAANIASRQLVDSADLAVLGTMSRTLPAGSRVITDDLWDAGMWVSAVTPDHLLVPKGYIGGELSKPLVDALANACTNPAAAERALGSFDAIFIGSHRMPGAPPGWRSNCIQALPGVRQIAHASENGGEAAAYAVR